MEQHSASLISTRRTRCTPRILPWIPRTTIYYSERYTSSGSTGTCTSAVSSALAVGTGPPFPPFAPFPPPPFAPPLLPLPAGASVCGGGGGGGGGRGRYDHAASDRPARSRLEGARRSNRVGGISGDMVQLRGGFVLGVDAIMTAAASCRMPSPKKRGRHHSARPPQLLSVV